MAKALHLLPISVAALGMVVHLLGLFGIDPQGAAREGHVIMLLVDSSVFVGLLRRRLWGYWLAIVLFGQQTLFQTYWAYVAALSESPLWEIQLATPGVCLACLLVLLLRRDLFSGQDSPTRAPD